MKAKHNFAEVTNNNTMLIILFCNSIDVFLQPIKRLSIFFVKIIHESDKYIKRESFIVAFFYKSKKLKNVKSTI